MELLRALRTVPRLDAADWSRLGPAARCAVAARVSVLQMTLVSALIGGVFAMPQPGFSPGYWLLCTLGLLAAHAANNLLNDYVDHRRGVDRERGYRARYGAHVLLQGLVSKRQMLLYMASALLVALCCGLALVYLRGGLVLPLMLVGALFLFSYTWPLKVTGLGELSVLLVWGPLMCAGTAYASCGVWLDSAMLLGLVYGIGPTLVLLGKHLDKLAEDAPAGVRTLPVLLGESNTRQLALTLLVLQYLLVLLLVPSSVVRWPVLLCMLNVGAALRLARVLMSVRPERAPEGYPGRLWPLWYSHNAFALNRRFALWLLAGLLLGQLPG